MDTPDQRSIDPFPAEHLPWVYPSGQPEIRTLSGLSAGSTIVFASVPSVRNAAPTLVRQLLQVLGRIDPDRRSAAMQTNFALQKNPAGGPSLLVDGQPGPALTFSHAAGRTWAALANRGSVGIDVARPEEFSGSYPFNRVFGPQELSGVKNLTGNDITLAAALLWSVKEAAVKAVGSGFHTIAPLDVRVGIPNIRAQGLLFKVRAGKTVAAWVRAECRGWLALASSSPTCGRRFKAALCAGSPPAARCPSGPQR